MSKTLKKLLIVLGAVILLGLIIFGVNRARNNQTSSTAGSQVGLSTTDTSGAPTLSGAISNEVPNVASARTRELVEILNSVSTLRLDKEVFDHPGFNLLRDVSTNLPAVSIVGRNNPFLPIGASGSNSPFTPDTANNSTSSGAFGLPQSSGAVIRINTDANTANQEGASSAVTSKTTEAQSVSGTSSSITTNNQDLVGQDAVDAFLGTGDDSDTQSEGAQ